MAITKVTITGADDSIRPTELIELSERFPFVEWGILLSKSSEGRTRFPSLDWMHLLGDIKRANPNMGLSGHLCGKWVRDLCNGQNEFGLDRPSLVAMFDRLQLNFHAYQHKIRPAFIPALTELMDGRQVIFQFDRVNDALLGEAFKAGINGVPLFDTSGGIGRLPDEWPIAIDGMYCGYAGGLGPDNLSEQIEKIELASSGQDIWIDMETRVRSDDDSLFDMSKVEACLKIAEHYVRK